MTIKEVLIAGRAKIADERHWLRGALATDASGIDVFANDPRACNFCTIGALFAVDHYTTAREAENYLSIFAGDFLDTFNDSHSHTEVLALFDKAIASCPVQP